MTRTLRVLGAAAVVAAVALSATRLSANARGVGRPRLDVPVAHESRSPRSQTLVLPLQQYQLTKQQSRAVNFAYNLLVADCMQRHEFRWPVVDLRHASVTQDRRYGLSDAEEARQYGYDQVPPSDAERAALALNGRALAADEESALQACQRSAPLARLQRFAIPDDPAERIIYYTALHSAEARHVIEEWRDCLKSQGYDTSASDDRLWVPFGVGRSAVFDRRAAVADVACKDRLTVIPRLYSIESRFQRQYIAAHHEQLQARRERVLALMALVDAVIDRCTDRMGTTSSSHSETAAVDACT